MSRLKRMSCAAMAGAALAVSSIGVTAAGAAPSGVALAKHATAKAMLTPATLSVTTPLTTKPPKGKTVVYLQTENPQSALQGQGISAAATSLGWKEKTLNYNETNPATLVTALQQAFQYHPVGVFFNGTPQSEWESVLPAYKKAGAIIVPSFVPDVTLSSTVPASLGGNDYSELQGNELANFVIAHSNGNAKVLFTTVPDYTIFGPFESAFKAMMTSRCPACSVSVLGVSIEQFEQNELVPQVVSDLRKSPSTHYVVSVDGPFIAGLLPALAAAGISGTNIVTGSASTQDEQNVKSGTETAALGEGLAEGGWYDVDVVLRHLEGMKILPGDGGLNAPLLTQANVTVSTTGDYSLPATYPQQFEKLWKVS